METKLQLTDRQNELMRQLRQLLMSMERESITLIYEEDKQGIFAYNSTEVCVISADPTDVLNETEGYEGYEIIEDMGTGVFPIDLKGEGYIMFGKLK